MLLQNTLLGILGWIHRRPVRVALIAVPFLFFILTHHLLPSEQDKSPPYYEWDEQSSIPPPLPEEQAHPAPVPDHCNKSQAELFRRFQVVLKTGVAEDKHKLNASLSTVLSCVHNLLVISDLPEDVGPHTAVDVLANLPAAYTKSPDYAVYSKQQDLLRDGKEPTGPDIQGWRLDRFKFLPMIEEAARSRPEASWYIFVEADT